MKTTALSSVSAQPLDSSEGPSTLTDLPTDVLEKIAGHLDVNDLEALTQVHDRLRTGLSYPLTRARTLRMASQADRPEKVARVLEEIAGLRGSDQLEPLTLLAARLRRWPDASQRPELLSQFKETIPTLLHVRRHPECEVRLRLACHETAWSAVEDGEAGEAGVGSEAIAHHFELSSKRDLARLQWTANNIDASIAAKNGASCVEVRLRHMPRGLSDTEQDAYRHHVALRFCDGPAGQAVKEGTRVQTVMKRHNISDNAAVERLDAMAFELAGAAVRKGANVEEEYLRRGFWRTGPYIELQKMACQGPAGDAVRAGEDIREVARRFGIDNPNYLREALPPPSEQPARAPC